MDRRGFIRGALMTAVFLGTINTSAWASREDDRYAISMHNTHTGEDIYLVYRDERGCFPDAMARLNRFLRCHYNDKVHVIDPSLIDLLNKVDRSHGGGNRIQVISGYRSPEYNAVLTNRSNGVAGKSLHMKGLALDFRIPGVGMRSLYNTVRSLEGGGAGIYPEFVHMDVGRVRSWGTGAA